MMTLRNLYRPTHYDRSLPLPRGWLVLCASTLAWLMFWGLGYGLWLLVRAVGGLS
jgi:hypothetical protein